MLAGQAGTDLQGQTIVVDPENLPNSIPDPVSGGGWYRQGAAVDDRSWFAMPMLQIQSEVQTLTGPTIYCTR